MDTATLGIGMAILGILIMQVNLWFWLKKIVERADWNVEDLNQKYSHLQERADSAREGLNVHDSKLDAQVEVNVHLAEDIAKLSEDVRLAEAAQKEFTLHVCDDIVGLQNSLRNLFPEIKKKVAKENKVKTLHK